MMDDNFKMITNEDSNTMRVSGARQRPEPDFAKKVTMSVDHNSSASLSVTMYIYIYVSARRVNYRRM